MNGHLVAFGHLIKLINAADASIGQHQSAALQNHLAGYLVFGHRCGQTDAGRTATGRVLTSGRHSIDEAEQLRFGHT